MSTRHTGILGDCEKHIVPSAGIKIGLPAKKGPSLLFHFDSNGENGYTGIVDFIYFQYNR